LLIHFLFFLAAILAGALNSLAGGGGLIGGYVGGMVSNRASRRFLRALFIVIGFSATAYYFWHVCTARRSHASGANSGPDTRRTP
jgi:uncharacterized membrane protein YfcA